MGKEESFFYLPVIKKLKNEGIHIEGPFSPGSLFSKDNLKKYNLFITPYHDQALIPFKIISGFNGINYTGGLDFFRISPDHGTAYKMVGIKKSNYKSLFYSFVFLKKIIKNNKSV